MKSYVNTHAQLEARRDKALQALQAGRTNVTGPRVSFAKHGRLRQVGARTKINLDRSHGTNQGGRKGGRIPRGASSFKHVCWKRSMSDLVFLVQLKVMIVGEADSGKSTLANILAAYAVRLGRCPTFVDLDVGQGMITVPGGIAAAALDSNSMSVEVGGSMRIFRSLVALLLGRQRRQRRRQLAEGHI